MFDKICLIYENNKQSEHMQTEYVVYSVKTELLKIWEQNIFDMSLNPEAKPFIPAKQTQSNITIKNDNDLQNDGIQLTNKHVNVSDIIQLQVW